MNFFLFTIASNASLALDGINEGLTYICMTLLAFCAVIAIIHIIDSDGNIPLHYAIKYKHINFICQGLNLSKLKKNSKF